MLNKKTLWCAVSILTLFALFELILVWTYSAQKAATPPGVATYPPPFASNSPTLAPNQLPEDTKKVESERRRKEAALAWMAHVKAMQADELGKGVHELHEMNQETPGRLRLKRPYESRYEEFFRYYLAEVRRDFGDSSADVIEGVAIDVWGYKPKKENE